MLTLLVPLVGILAGVGAALFFRAHPIAAAVAAAIIPVVLFFCYAVYRSGPDIIPWLWMLAVMWAVFVTAGFLFVKFGFQAR